MNYRKEILRSISIQGKCTWLLQLLGARPIAKQHVKMIQHISELRNAFVHYKWTMTDIDASPREQDTAIVVAKALKNYEKTIKYLHKYESDKVLYRSSRRAYRLAKKN